MPEIWIFWDLGWDLNLVPNVLVWKDSKDGSFSVKQAYWTANGHHLNRKEPMWKLLWFSKMHEKYKLLLWRLARDTLPTSEHLQQIFRNQTNGCQLCDLGRDSMIHLFLRYPLAKYVSFGRVSGICDWKELGAFQAKIWSIGSLMPHISPEMKDKPGPHSSSLQLSLVREFELLIMKNTTRGWSQTRRLSCLQLMLWLRNISQEVQFIAPIRAMIRLQSIG